MKITGLATATYLAVALNTWAFNYHRGWCAGPPTPFSIAYSLEESDRRFCSVVTGFAWPLYWPMRIVFITWSPR